MKKLMLILLVVFFLSGFGLLVGAFQAGLFFSLIAIVTVALLIILVRVAVKLISKMSFFIVEQY